MSSTDPNLGLTYNWAIGANVKTDMDANLKKLGAVVQLSVLAIANDPPVSPASGDRYIVGVGTGAWLNHDNKIAIFIGAAWEFYVPATGWWAYNQDSDTYWKFDAAWAEYAASTVPYDNTTSELTATNVQAAIDELKALIDAITGT